MSVLQFIAAVVGELAWPAAVFGIAWLIRHELRRIIPFITSLKGPGVEITIDRQVQEAKELAAATIPQLPGTAVEDIPPEFELVHHLLDISPRHALIEAWRLLEAAGTEVIRGSGQSLKSHLQAPVSFGEALKHSGMIGSEEMRIIAELRTVRNKAVHLQDFQIDESTARDYAATALKLWRRLRGKV